MNSLSFLEKTLKESEWVPFFAWYPVKVNREWCWLKKVYRRQIFWTVAGVEVDPPWQYGTLLDVLAEK